MSVRVIKKIKLLLIATLFSMLAMVFYFVFPAKADDFLIEELDFTMQENAEFFADRDNDKYGLKFTATIAQTDYELLLAQKANGAYSKIEYGVVILPKYYTDNYPVDESTLFGEGAIYDFANYVNHDWIYEGNKIRVININANDWEDCGNYLTYYGAIVDIMDGSDVYGGVNNLCLDFYATAYVKVTLSDGTAEFKFTDGVCSTMSYVCQKAIEGSEYSQAEKQFIKENFIDKVTDEFYYSTEYYLETDEGYTLIGSELSETSYPIGTVVTAEYSDLPATGFVFDAQNSLNVISSPVYANDKTVLKVYYKLDSENGLLDIGKISAVDFEFIGTGNPAVTKYKLYKTVGNSEFEISYSSGSVTDITAFSGTYRFSAGHNDQTNAYVNDVSISFDCYDSTEEYIFTSTEFLNTSCAPVVARHVAVRGFVRGWGVDWMMTIPDTLPDNAPADADKFFYSTSDRYNGQTHLIYASQRAFIRPVHSKAYYEKAYDNKFVLRFDYYLACETDGTTRSVSVLNNGYETKTVNTWYTGEISFQAFMDNWDSLYSPVSNQTTERGALLNISADTVNKIAIGIYIGNIRFEDSRIMDDTTEYLIDVNGESEYDLRLHLPQKVLSAINDYSQSSNIYYTLSVNGVDYMPPDGVIDLSDASLLRKGQITVMRNTTVLYTGCVDLFDSTKQYEWNSINGNEIILKTSPYSVSESQISGDKIYEIINASSVTDTQSVLYGRIGNYLKFSSTAPENVVMSILPQHYMEYYRQLYGKGYVLTYDYYATTTTVARYVGTANYENAFKTWRGQLVETKWGTVSISFDNFILQSDRTFSGYWYDPDNQGTSGSVSDRLSVFELPANTDMYIGNLRIEQMPEHIAYNTASTDLDVGGRPFIDLLYCLDEVQREKYELYVDKYDSLFTWKLSFADGTSETFTAGQTRFNVSDYADKLQAGRVNISATIRANAPDNVYRNYTVVTLSNKLFTNFATEISARISAVMSNVEILQNVDHYSAGDLIDASGIEITVVKNETESAQIIITPYDDVGYYDIELLDLKDGSNYLYATDFTAYHQYYVEIKRAMGLYYPYPTGMYPDALIPMENAKSNLINCIDSGENQGIWIQFNIPADQPAGTYTGVFKITLENSLYTVPVTVKVMNYSLSDERHLITRFGLSTSDIRALEDVSDMTDEEFQRFADEYYYEALFDYGINLGSFYTYNAERWAGTYWIGRPYNPDVIFSFEQIYVDGGYHYAYEYPLVSLGEGDEMIVWTGGYKNGYGFNRSKVDEWVEQALKYVSDDRVVSYSMPVIAGASVKFTKDSLDILYPSGNLGYGNYTEARDTLEDGYRINSVNLLTTRDVYEQIFLASVENGVDLFKKGNLFCSWIDEYNNSPSKLKVAKIIIAIMKDYFPDLAEWLKIKYSVTDEFALSVIDSISKLQIITTGENTYDFDPDIHWMAHCPGDGQYNGQKRRTEILEWANSVYNGEGIVWAYNGGYKIEDPMATIRVRTWWMYDYDVEADLQWAIMSHQYLDGISSALVGKAVSDGDFIDPTDFYNIAVHYGGMSGIGYMVYPGSVFGVKGFVPSIRLDSYRDSVEDYELLYALERFLEKRAEDEGLEYNPEDFDSLMDRLGERIYKGSKYKTQEGFEEDFIVSRNSLVSMLALAENYGIVFERVTLGSDITFTVSTPDSIVLSGYKTVEHSNGFNIYTFTAGEEYCSFTYADLTVNLSVSVYRDNALIEGLEWTDNQDDEYKTYSEKVVNSTSKPVSVEKVVLNAAYTVGGVTEGEYYKISPVNKSDWGMHLGFTLMPDHDKAYYEQYASITSLKFDVYFQLKDENGDHPDRYRLYYYLDHSENSQHLSNEWFTIEIEMSTILEQWDKLTATQNATAYRVTDGNLFTLFGSYGSTALDYDLFIGNFRIEHN